MLNGTASTSVCLSQVLGTAFTSERYSFHEYMPVYVFHKSLAQLSQVKDLYSFHEYMPVYVFHKSLVQLSRVKGTAFTTACRACVCLSLGLCKYYCCVSQVGFRAHAKRNSFHLGTHAQKLCTHCRDDDADDVDEPPRDAVG